MAHIRVIGYRELRKAQQALAKGAVGVSEFPRLHGMDNGRVSIAGRLAYLDVDIDGANKFARKLISRDDYSITVVHGPFWKHQLRVVHAAIMAGIAVGIQAERMRRQ